MMLVGNSPSAQLVQPASFRSSQPEQSLTENNNDKQEKATNNTSPQKDNNSDTQLSVSDRQVLQQLKNRDREVRAHELAHVVAGGRYTSAAQFSYQRGPDGKLYAVGGEVSINNSKIPGDPRVTLLKAQTVSRAALAPANPSSQDRRVAAQAAVMIQQSRIELAALLKESSSESKGQKLDTFV